MVSCMLLDVIGSPGGNMPLRCIGEKFIFVRMW